MKIQVQVKALENALKKLSAVESKNMPILAYAKAVTTNGALQLSSTNLEAAVHLSLPVTVIKAGSGLLPMSRLLSLLSTFQGDVTISVGKNSAVSVANASYKGDLKAESPDTFPPLDELPKEKGFTFNLPILKKMAERVIFAVVQNEQQFVIPCALLQSDGKTLSLVATDGYRLPITTAKVDGLEFDFVIPKQALQLLNILDGENVSMFESDIAFFFVTPNMSISIQKTNAEFVDYKNVLPTSFKTEITLGVAAFKTALDRAQVIVDSAQPIVAIEVVEGAIKVEAVSVEGGQSLDNVNAVISGPALRFGINNDLLREFLGHVDGEIKIRASDPLDPIDIYSSESYRYVVLPVQLTAKAAAVVTE